MKFLVSFGMGGEGMLQEKIKVLWCLNTWREHWQESWVEALLPLLMARPDLDVTVWTVENIHRGLAAEISTGGFDLVHVHGSEGAWAGVRDFGGVPVVVSLQGILTALTPVYCGGLSPLNLWRDFRLGEFIKTHYTIGRGARIWRQRFAPRERGFLRRVDAVLGRTTWDCSWARQLAPQANYLKVGEVLRSPFFAAEGSWRPTRSARIFCGAAFRYPLKGGHVVLRALQRLRQVVPDVELRVADAQGEGPYGRYLSRLAKRLGVESAVVRLPRLNAAETVDELQSAAVFALPSFGENSPNALAEALCVGTPCVASCVGGIPEMLPQEACVGVGDADGLANKILGRMNCTSVNGSWRTPREEQVCQELLAAYRHVIGKK